MLVGLCTHIFYSWVRGDLSYFKSSVVIPDMETVLATIPKNRARNCKSLIRKNLFNVTDRDRNKLGLQKCYLV